MGKEGEKNGRRSTQEGGVTRGGENKEGEGKGGERGGDERRARDERERGRTEVVRKGGERGKKMIAGGGEGKGFMGDTYSRSATKLGCADMNLARMHSCTATEE